MAARIDRDKLLQDDVAAMVKDHRDMYSNTSDRELAHDIIVVVRERVLREMESVIRERVR